MKKYKWLIWSLVIYFVLCSSAWLVAQRNTGMVRQELADAQQRTQIAEGERGNAAESARQWKAMYDLSLMEIAALKEENEELTRRWEEVSFAYDEVCYETGWTGSGTFRITHYCACPICCGQDASGVTATGTTATAGRTVAVDPSVIPLGSEVLINGVVYIAEDTGVQGKTIDLFVDDHAQALAMGTYLTDVSWR